MNVHLRPSVPAKIPSSSTYDVVASNQISLVAHYERVVGAYHECGEVKGQTVRIYSLARTVAECFRFRNKIGLDVALEALADAWRSKRLKLDELSRIAKTLRIQRVIQPYLEAVVM